MLHSAVFLILVLGVEHEAAGAKVEMMPPPDTLVT